MPYLIYPPDTLSDTTAHVYAIEFPDRVDEIMVEDLRSWGWRVVEHDHTDLTWRRAMHNLHAEGRTGLDASSERRMPSLWEIWNDSKERLGVHEQRGMLRRGRSLVGRIRRKGGRAEPTRGTTRSASRGRTLVRTVLRQLDCSRPNRTVNDV
jgi:hypothetical protein